MTWELTKLSEFLKEREDRIKSDSANTLGLQRIKKIDFSGLIHLQSETDTKTDMIRICQGDLVISGINAAKGAIAVYKGDEDVLATIHYSAYEFNPDRISVEYLNWFFKSPEFSRLLKEQVAGGIKTELKAKHLLPLEINLPSLCEQIMIAEKLNKLHSAQLRLELEVEKQQSFIDQLKQSVLNEAFQGKLTKSWRVLNPAVESAASWLDRMKKMKGSLNRPNERRAEKVLAMVDESEVPFEIPDSWEWCRLGALLLEKPRNGLSLKPVDYETATKTLKLSATTSGYFDGTQIKYLEAEIEEDSHLWLKDGDILIQRANSMELVGAAAVYRGGSHEYIYPDLMMKCRPIDSSATEYIHAVLSSKFTKDYYQRNATGAAGNMPKINQATVVNTLIPLPPAAELERILQEISELFKLIDDARLTVGKNATHIQQLSDAVLYETFLLAA